MHLKLCLFYFLSLILTHDIIFAGDSFNLPLGLVQKYEDDLPLSPKKLVPLSPIKRAMDYDPTNIDEVKSYKNDTVGVVSLQSNDDIISHRPSIKDDSLKVD